MVIPTGASNYPIINSSASSKNITINPSANLTVGSGADLTVYGELLNRGFVTIFGDVIIN